MNALTETLAVPLGRAYLAVAAARNALYERGVLRVHDAGGPVLCVGNISVGGTGKTPTVRRLAATLADRSERVAVVSRGYGGRPDALPLFVRRAGRIVAAVEQSGDEARMIAEDDRLHAVVVDPDRVRGARAAFSDGATVVVLDDGFQHRRLRRDADVVLADWSDPLGGGRGLPAGRLRESPRGLRRARALVLTRAPDAFAEQDTPLERDALPQRALAAALAKLGSDAPLVFAARHAPESLAGPSGHAEDAAALAGRRVLAVCGIAQPASFRASLAALGASIEGFLPWPDHHAYTAHDAERIARACEATRADLLVTTEKDAVRWPREAPPAHVLRVRVACGAWKRLVAQLLEAIAERSA